jgi:hypothetical protein
LDGSRKVYYDFKGSLLPGETSDTLFGEFNQEYYVQATTLQGCTTNSDCVLITRVEDQEILSLSVYPNPSNERIYVAGKNDMPTRVIIYDAYGKLVLNQLLVGRELNIAHLTSGSYFLTIPEYGFNKCIIKL